MRIDCYGNETKAETYERGLRVRPLETKVSGAWTFMHFAEGERVAIHKFGVGADGVVEETWAYGSWVDAERLDYIPLSHTMEVDA